MDAIQTGKSGEQRARAFLESKGYAFLGANFTTRLGEIDLIMQKKDTIVFVEVKYRQSNSFGRPHEFVTYAKQAKVVRAAIEYLKTTGKIREPFRFDVVALGEEKIDHFENAFTAPPGKYTI